VRIEWVGDDHEPGVGLPLSKAVTFDVERQWKGTAGEALTVFTGSGGGDCGSPFDVGRTYLVYATAREGSAGGVLQSSICHRGLAADPQDPRARYEFEELDRLVLGRGVPDPETARQRDAIRRVYQDFRMAVMRLRSTKFHEALTRSVPPGRPMSEPPEPAGTPEEVISFVCAGVVDHYAELRELALQASKEDLLAGSLFVAMEVLALRHRIDGAALSAMSPADLMRRFYDEGWEPRLGLVELELGKFGTLGDEVYVDGVRGTSNLDPRSMILPSAFRFEQVEGGWCLDTVWNLASAEAGQTLRIVAAQQGRPLDDYVLELLGGMLQNQGYGQSSGLPVEASPDLWEPFAGAR
jgi:hypothetical protein